MFTAVLQLHGIAPKFSTIARRFSSTTSQTSVSLDSIGDSPQSGYLRRVSFYSALVRLSYSQIRIRLCLSLHSRKNSTLISLYRSLHNTVASTRVEIRCHILATSGSRSIRYALSLIIIFSRSISLVFAEARDSSNDSFMMSSGIVNHRLSRLLLFYLF